MSAISAIGLSGGVSTSLAQDLVEQKMATYTYRANLRSIHADQQMMGSLLDIEA